MIASIDIDIAAQSAYRLTTKLKIDGPAPRSAPALLTCKFLNSQGEPVKDLPAGFLWSELYGAHVHLGPAGVAGEVSATQVITPPESATSATLTLHRWRARDLAISEPLRIEPYSPPAEAPAPDPRLLWQYETTTSPGETHELMAQFTHALAERDVVAAVCFTDANGVELTPDGNVPKSGEVGFFRYLTPTEETVGYARFHAPPGAKMISVSLFRWINNSTLALNTATLSTRSTREDLIGSGHLSWTSDDWCVLKAGLVVNGPDPIVIDLSFLDADQRMLTTPATGLDRNAQYDNFNRFSADPLSRHDGSIQMHLAFKPPTGTQSVRWHMLLPEGGAHQIANDPVLSALEGADDEQQPVWTNTDPELAQSLGNNPPTEHEHRHISQKGYDCLARLACPVQPGEWSVLSAQFSRPKGGLQRANVILLATYFSEDKTPLKHPALPGFGRTADLALHRSLCLSAPNITGDMAQIETPLLCPDDAAYAMFDLVACHHDAGIDVSSLSAAPAPASDVCHALNLVEMSKHQLIQALDIAEHAEDMQARHAIFQALSVVDPETKGYAYRARILGETLHLLEPGWLPETGTVKPYTPVQNHIFHLIDASVPDLTLADQQAHDGLLPMIGTGLNADMPVLTEPQLASGALVAHMAFPKADADEMPPADRLAVETRQHGKSVARHRASLIHAKTDFVRCDTALKAMALAQAYAVPLVYDLHDIPDEDRQGPERAMYDRCMAGANQIIVSTIRDQSRLSANHVASERMTLIPDAVAPEFETVGASAEINGLRQALDIQGKATIGYVCPIDEPDPEAAAELKQSLIGLLGTITPLTLILIGPEATSAAYTHLLQHPELRILHANPGQQEDLRIWYGLCNAILPSAQATSHQVIETGLRAMAQGVPVALPEGPDTVVLAGPDQTRARLFDDHASATVTSVLANTLLDRTGCAAQTASAQQWIRTERLWRHRLPLYQAAYQAARAHHAERTR